LLTNLICLFPAGHAVIPLGLFEPILISGAITTTTESPAMWICSAILLILGQTLIVIALTQKVEKKVSRFGLIGLLVLILATVSVYLTMHERLWAITLLTAIPFIILSWIFLQKTILDK
jgi:hypothetical protein